MARQFAALVAATAVFALAIAAALLALPYALGALYGCLPPAGSCGDSVGWGMLISAPVTAPLTILIAGALAVLTYFRALNWISRPGR